jgi:hypothetical protein
VYIASLVLALSFRCFHSHSYHSLCDFSLLVCQHRNRSARRLRGFCQTFVPVPVSKLHLS